MKKQTFVTAKLFLVFIVVFIASCTGPVANSTNENPDPWANKVIYEVNIRQYTPEGTFSAFQNHLTRLKELGVDILWIMPIYPIGEKNRKGTMGSYYSIKDYKALNPEFGTSEDFKILVDKIHEMGMTVILDWVANHTAWDNPLIKEHKNWYKHNEKGEIIAPVADWTDVAGLNYENHDLRNYMIDAMKFWIQEFNIDGFRCDVAGMVPTDFWEAAHDSLNKIKPVFMLAEAEKEELLQNAFDMDYGWWMMHGINEIAKGNKDATYIDTILSAQQTKYQPDDIRMYFTTNHDENSWNGTVHKRLGNATKCFSTLCFMLDGMPLLYNGQEVGFNKALSFFDKDTIIWFDNGYMNFYKTLIYLKHSKPALECGENGGSFTKISSSDDNKIFSFIRQKYDNKVLVILNLSNENVDANIESNYIAGDYIDIFNEAEIILETKMDLHLKPWEYRVLVQ